MHRLLLLLLLAGCVTEYSRKRTSGDDPSDPAAPAAAPRDVALYETPAAQPPAAAPAGAYVCPMHPDVQSAEPGTCPKCGMGLVKQ
jgi:hypothetical protein